MRKLALMLLLAGSAWAQELQLPAPPPVLPEPKQGKGAPFDPNQTREALPQPPIELPHPSPAPPDAPQGPVTLAQAIDLALRLQPDILTARGQIQQATGQTTVLRAQLMPRVGGSSTYTHRSTTNAGLFRPLTTTSDTLDTSLGVNYLLFDFHNTQDRVRQADKLRQAAESGLLATQNDTALTVKERFYSMLQIQRLVEVSEADVTNRREQLRLARALYQAGNMSPGDVVRAQTTVSNAVFSLNNNRRNLELARQDLIQAIGLPPLTLVEFAIQAEPELEHKEVPYLMETAAGHRPELLQARQTIEARQAGLDAAHTTNYPSLSSFAGMSYQGAANGVQYPSLTVQLNLDFSLFDGGERSGTIQSAEGSLDVARAVYRRTELAVQREVGGVLEQLLTAERNVDVTAKAVDSAREGIRIATGRYQAALGSLTDVFDAQNAYVQARNAYANSLTDLDLARARLRHALADPFGEGYFPVNTPLDLEPPRPPAPPTPPAPPPLPPTDPALPPAPPPAR